MTDKLIMEHTKQGWKAMSETEIEQIKALDSMPTVHAANLNFKAGTITKDMHRYSKNQLLSQMFILEDRLNRSVVREKETATLHRRAVESSLSAKLLLDDTKEEIKVLQMKNTRLVELLDMIIEQYIAQDR